MSSVMIRFKEAVDQLLANSQGHSVVTPENVLQHGNMKNQEIVLQLVGGLLLPGSGIRGLENLKDLATLSAQGKSCLLLVEHYSNFDLPGLIALLTQAGEKEIAGSITAIAGMKLNEENPLVLAFTEAFTRIVIYPSRSLNSITDPQALAEETQKSNRINMAAMKELTRAKHHGKLILVFPSGTRYRPGKPETQKGLKEIDTYLRTFDYFLPMAINGNILRIDESGAMHMDIPAPDKLVFTCGPVMTSSDFRKSCQDKCPEGEDPKQYSVDQVMVILKELHDQTEKTR